MRLFWFSLFKKRKAATRCQCVTLEYQLQSACLEIKMPFYIFKVLNVLCRIERRILDFGEQKLQERGAAALGNRKQM